MSNRLSIAAAAVATALAVGLVAVDTWAAGAGGLWAALMAIVIMTLPLGAAAEIRQLRGAGKDDAADALLRWMAGAVVAVAIIVFLDSTRVDLITKNDDCGADQP